MIKISKNNAISSFIKRNHVHIVIFSTIITLIGFSLAIAAESRNSDIKKLKRDDINDFKQIENMFNLREEADTFAFVGIILLFVGFLITSLVQTYVLFSTRQKIIK